ncbi:YycH family regulatory protein [Virgibacillus sp. W0430]|uniref:YycH family regulatory protein n=1 Tax=Virgibacillus sp. W0430 TaxID=3391580 RepID=UPI003F465D0C
MTYERIKTFILTLLVGISLLLTFALWSNQPNFDQFHDTRYINQGDLGGKEEKKKGIIEPSSIIFHENGTHYGFKNPLSMASLTKDMHTWVLYDFQPGEARGRPKNKQQVEVIFPSPIPMSILPSLLKFNKENYMPNWSFQRIHITFKEKSRSLELLFLSVDGRKQATAVVDKSDKYELLVNYFKERELFEEYISFSNATTTIYLPKNPVVMHRKTLATTTIEPDLLVNVLFSTPSLVSANIGEAYFTDSQRGMRLLQDGRAIEYTNPIQSNYERMEIIELFDKSISNINEHKGWTNDYKFESADKSINEIRYRMYYDGYPVFDYADLSVIEQEWRSQELYQYYRPLFVLNNSLGQDEVNLPSGQAVLNYLESSDNFELRNIKDIRIGYHLDDTENASHSIALRPGWYINYNGSWRQVDVANSYSFKGGM